MPSLVHHLTSPGQLTAATVVCGDPSAAVATWDAAKVTCPTCQRGVCTCAPGVPLCAPCRTWNAAHRGRPTTAPALKTEKAFQAWVQQQAVAAGFLYYHVYDARRSPPGFPDTVLCRGEHLIIAELKMSGKRPTPPQQMWLDALAQVTQVETHLWTPDDLAQILEVLR